MSRYLAGRVMVMIPTIIVLSLVLFVLMRLTPGSPLQPIAPNANPLSPEAQEALAKEWGLDKPILEQYAIYVWKARPARFRHVVPVQDANRHRDPRADAARSRCTSG